MKKYLGIFCYIILLNVVSLYAQTSATKFPIVAWGSVPEEYTNSLQYRLLKEAGISITFTHFRSLDKAKEALDLAAKFGIKILLYCPELFSETEKTVRAVKDHPGLAGYFLADEPKLEKFASLRKLVNQIRAIDKKGICYINLYPNYASNKQLGGVDYNEYLERFFSSVELPMYTFDHYPIKNSILRTNWYENLEQFTALTKKRDGVFWAFVKITSIQDESDIIRMPDLQLQTFSNLAYGAQGIQFYRYWSLKGQMFNSPMSLKGTVNPNYNKLKQITQYINNLAPFFLGCEILQVYHTNNTKGTLKFSPTTFKYLSFPRGADNLLISHIKNGDSRFIVLVNKDLKKTNKLNVKINVNGSLIDKDIMSKSVSSGSTYNLAIDPGDILILKYQ